MNILDVLKILLFKNLNDDQTLIKNFIIITLQISVKLKFLKS